MVSFKELIFNSFHFRMGMVVFNELFFLTFSMLGRSTGPQRTEL